MLAATCPMLQSAACALSAKRISRQLSSPRSGRRTQLDLEHTHLTIPNWDKINWHYQIIQFYDEAIRQLKDALMPDAIDARFQNGEEFPEDILGVVAIMSMFELMDAPGVEWRAHLSALPLLNEVSQMTINLSNPLDHSRDHGRRSIFWSFARQDVISAFVHETQTFLNLDDRTLWNGFGLDTSDFGISMSKQELSHFSPPEIWREGSSPEESVSNAMTWILGRIINYITSGDSLNPLDFSRPTRRQAFFSVSQEALLERWCLLNTDLRRWYQSRPPTFNPSARSRITAADGCSSDVAAAFERTWYNVPMCAAAMQSYYMGRILLLMNRPQESTAIRSTVASRLKCYQDTERHVLNHSRQICGISLSMPPEAVRIHSLQPLYVAGQCFSRPHERQTVLDLLLGVERDLGWTVTYYVNKLREDMDTGIIGSVVVMDQFKQKFGSFSSVVHGLIVSSILIPAALSSFFGGKLADWVGRPKSIFVGALIFGVGAAIEAGAVHLAMFIVGRVIEGLGEGLYLGTLVVYICEVSPPKQRGPLATGPQLLITMGIVVGFFTCYGCERLYSSMAWRTPFTVLACISVLFSFSFLCLPESPRWLTLKNRLSDTARVWEYLEVNEADREELIEDENHIQETISNSLAPTGSILAPNTLDQVVSQCSHISKAKEATLFEAFGSDVRSRTFLGLFLMGMQQLAGIDGVLYYAPLLFQQAGMSSDQATFLASGVSGLVIFVVTIPALLYADSWGRRQNVILGGIGLTIVMVLIGSLYAADAVHQSTGAGRWIVIVCIYLFAAIYSVSWAVSCKIYAAEIQPQRTRASATCLAHGSNWVSNFFVALITPVLLAKSSCAAYFLFGACTLLTVVVCLFWMPETKGKSLEEVEKSFNKVT
ncbi:hypothetical protein BDV25DRAFT_171028 [Aspergillus avenaceus]|uniref:Major facilitator superfamily (MFS) profile domain-containing protein n=1 Tax=Aspergillus avenaceus TaxID=36643 RepID=A0A5N6U038_ASPAV|nr:hypothetical protein BDV25DRAFT_171028 [Aspergillus avenaceus]